MYQEKAAQMLNEKECNQAQELQDKIINNENESNECYDA